MTMNEEHIVISCSLAEENLSVKTYGCRVARRCQKLLQIPFESDVIEIQPPVSRFVLLRSIFYSPVQHEATSCHIYLNCFDRLPCQLRGLWGALQGVLAYGHLKN